MEAERCPDRRRSAQERAYTSEFVSVTTRSPFLIGGNMHTWQLVALAGAIGLVSACGEASAPSAPTRTVIPSSRLTTIVTKVPGSDDPGPPFYAASGNGGFLPHTDAWVAIPFERSLACVPAGANLLDIDIPGAFGCAMTVSGHAHWETGPGIDLAPRQSDLTGTAVPIVFAAWSEVRAAINDGILTLPELLALPSAVVGTATQYVETDIFGVSGPLGAGRGMYKITARGTLPGGASFRLHVDEVLGELRVVDIKFGE
jgi:hypothetical protein